MPDFLKYVFRSQVSLSLSALALMLLSFPERASLNREFDNSSGRVSLSLLGKSRYCTMEPPSLYLCFSFVVLSGTVYLGSVFVKEALQRAIELTDAAYARTTERYKLTGKI